MKRSSSWESYLHNLDRTDDRRNWRFQRNHVLGLELRDVVGSGKGDPGFEARAELFLQREERLLKAYFKEPKGKRKRVLLRQIAEALLADDLLGEVVFERIVRFGPRRVACDELSSWN